jgi:hypothetical protein
MSRSTLTVGWSRSAGTVGARRSRSANRWRVEESWWRDPIARDLREGRRERWLALIYQDRIAGTWHLERLYD